MSKVNELGVKIDTDKLISDLIMEFLKAIDVVADNLLNQMKSRAMSSEVQSSLEKEINMIGLEQVEILVGSSHLKAFLDNYGTGSKMATEAQNPYLSEYKSSRYWHSYRPTNAVTAREQGEYTVPDWESGTGETTRTSNGRIPAGTNLETVNWHDYNVKFRPTAPTFFVEHSMQFIEKVFEDKMLEVYKNFTFSKYLKGGG